MSFSLLSSTLNEFICNILPGFEEIVNELEYKEASESQGFHPLLNSSSSLLRSSAARCLKSSIESRLTGPRVGSAQVRIPLSRVILSMVQNP